MKTAKLGIITEDKLVQSLNSELLIAVIEFESSTLAKLLQYENALQPIVVKEFPTSTVFSDMQPWNAR